jgi:hyperosmotically inducible periplasmic protein
MKLNSLFKIIIISLCVLFTTQSFANKNNYVSDTVITSKIKGKIALDQSISVFNISVTTNHGVVSFDGVVDSDSQAESLLEIAQSTDGVRDINAENLSVKNSNHPIKDTLITAKVKGYFVKKRLLDNSNLPLENLHVETNNGVVYLTGSVNTQSQKMNAVRIAKSISGVKGVESRLQVLSNH